MRTCLYERHRGAGATIVDFHGWEMPIRYTQIPAEHQQVRHSAGLFDLCHMGRLELTGPAALAWVQRVVTADIEGLAPGTARYALICADDGGIIDDIIVYRLFDRLFIVVNAANRETDVAWFREQHPGGDAVLEDLTAELAMVALQGPESRAVLEPLLECEPPLAELRYYRIARARCADAGALVATTGYTGEPGYEVYLPAGAAPAFWDRVLETGGDRLAPVGLGARDTLRVEAGMPLYGQEIDRRTSPYEAGLGFAVDLDKGTPFVGREALAGIRAAGVQRKLVGLRIDSRKVARAGMPLFQKERQIGHVTSGIPSPTLGHPIAMALIESDVRQPDGIEVEIRGTRFPALPEPLPFYSRTRKRAARAL